MSVTVLSRLRVGNWAWLLAILSAASWAGFYLPLMLIRAVGDSGVGTGYFFMFMGIWWPFLVAVDVLVALVGIGCLFVAGTRVRKIVAVIAAINAVIFVFISLPILVD